MSATASLLAISACGTHESVAPVVYGGEDQRNARIYNSPQEVAAARSASSAYQASALGTSRAAPTQPVQALQPRSVTPIELEPVSSIYLSDEQRAAATQKASYQAPTRSADRIVTARRGDTVYAIGRRYNADPKDIIAVNKLRAPYHLSIGQRLRLPGDATRPQQQTATTTKTVASNAPARNATYTVKKGDTLYAISRKTGVSVAKLAQANSLRRPYTISPGQVIRTPGANYAPPPRIAEKPATRVASAPAPAPKTQDVAELTQKVSFAAPPASDALFAWPVRGAIISNYGVGEMGRRNDGINIAAPAGTPVRAAADGEVVYRGSELDGFGNLLLVKHTDGFVTAYAHNDAMLVDKGDVVRKGQVIAKVGQTGSVTTPQLHFEIRQKLKSVDPIALLEEK
jgi:murein DD-endopeptidase MepM/ murein hydrolase activator NlpD